ncbi:MAG: response regulator [Pirellulaceae bacterium]
MARIVVVDDEQGTCKYVAKQLEKDGHEVRYSLRGDEAVDLGHLFRPHLIIADWYLKDDYDGLEVVEACRHVNKNLKVIVITAYPSTELEDRLQQMEVDALIVKPFSLDEISDAVHEAIGEWFSPDRFSDN